MMNTTSLPDTLSRVSGLAAVRAWWPLGEGGMQGISASSSDQVGNFLGSSPPVILRLRDHASAFTETRVTQRLVN